ncbi:hypothetical protein MW887_000759 [Aspergillus wentii]|nr:hypothetical protein MW887_000759 [Aspergillus wentii]
MRFTTVILSTLAIASQTLALPNIPRGEGQPCESVDGCPGHLFCDEDTHTCVAGIPFHGGPCSGQEGDCLDDEWCDPFSGSCRPDSEMKRGSGCPPGLTDGENGCVPPIVSSLHARGDLQ